MSQLTHCSIAIVSPDLVGLVRNGGVGTACTELAKALAASGAAVTVFFSQFGSLGDSSGAIMAAKEGYRRHGIDLVVADEWGGSATHAINFPPNPFLRTSYIVHEWLKEMHFDIVLFMDWQGAAFYPMMARRAGLAHSQHGVFAVVCHGPTLWSDLGNSAHRRDPLDALTYYIERRSIEMADAVISPSSYLLDWMRERGFVLPARTLVQPNLLELPMLTHTEGPVDEVVFFGRLEYRKGIVQFCAAIDRLIACGEAPKRVTFLGKLGFVGEEHAAIFLARRTRDWPVQVEILNRLGQPEALRVLATRHCLAVVPSTVENSPYTVYECLLARVPVIARNVGGISELYAPEYRETHLFDDNPKTLADRIKIAIDGRLPTAQLSFSPDENRKQWVERLPALVGKITTERAIKKVAVAQPLVSICLTHYRRPKLLLQAMRGILAQTYVNIEVILVDDGSDQPETDALLARLETDPDTQDWNIKRVTNGFPGRARNLAVAEASGEYLLFLDDDNVAKSEMVEALVSAAVQSNAEVVTCFAAVFEGNDEPGPKTIVVDTYMPVGGALGYALFGNAISDTSALIKRKFFNELGGFTEDYGIGHEDFELFLRASLLGKEVLVVPEVLYWYRRHGTSVGSVTPHAANRSRSLRPFVEHFQPDMAELLVVAHGLWDVPGPRGLRDGLEDQNGDLAVLAQRDPDSWQSIDAAASIVSAQGAIGMAKQLLLQLPEDTPDAEARLLRARALDIIASGNVDQMYQILDQAQGIGENQLRNFIAFTARVSKERHDEFALNLLKRWVSIDENALEPRLLLVETLDKAGRTSDAIGALDEALRVADFGYRAARPDIGAAVQRGDFETGLVHYERHGRHENAPWPEVLTFARLAVQLYSSLIESQSSSLESCSELVKLAFAAFSPNLQKTAQ